MADPACHVVDLSLGRRIRLWRLAGRNPVQIDYYYSGLCGVWSAAGAADEPAGLGGAGGGDDGRARAPNVLSTPPLHHLSVAGDHALGPDRMARGTPAPMDTM